MIRKIIFCLFVVSTVLFAACEKKANAPDSLSNTTWNLHTISADEQTTATLYFYEDTYRCEMAFTDEDGTFNDAFSGKYYYTAPNITLENEGDTLEGVVDGDRMIFSESEGTVSIFERM